MTEHGYEFTTTRYISWGYREDAVREGNISFGFLAEPAINLDQPLRLTGGSRRTMFQFDGKAPIALEIYIGDEAVKQWFLKQHPLLFGDKRTEENLLRQFWALAEKLDRPQLPPHEREMIENPVLQSVSGS